MNAVKHLCFTSQEPDPQLIGEEEEEEAKLTLTGDDGKALVLKEEFSDSDSD